MNKYDLTSSLQWWKNHAKQFPNELRYQYMFSISKFFKDPYIRTILVCQKVGTRPTLVPTTYKHSKKKRKKVLMDTLKLDGKF
jgi:hypothetical protein